MTDLSKRPLSHQLGYALDAVNANIELRRLATDVIRKAGDGFTEEDLPVELLAVLAEAKRKTKK